jgi:hypothetical protein
MKIITDIENAQRRTRAVIFGLYGMIVGTYALIIGWVLANHFWK